MRVVLLIVETIRKQLATTWKTSTNESLSNDLVLLVRESGGQKSTHFSSKCPQWVIVIVAHTTIQCPTLTSLSSSSLCHLTVILLYLCDPSLPLSMSLCQIEFITGPCLPSSLSLDVFDYPGQVTVLTRSRGTSETSPIFTYHKAPHFVVSPQGSDETCSESSPCKTVQVNRMDTERTGVYNQRIVCLWWQTGVYCHTC